MKLLAALAVTLGYSMGARPRQAQALREIDIVVDTPWARIPAQALDGTANWRGFWRDTQEEATLVEHNTGLALVNLTLGVGSQKLELKSTVTDDAIRVNMRIDGSKWAEEGRFPPDFLVVETPEPGMLLVTEQVKVTIQCVYPQACASGSWDGAVVRFTLDGKKLQDVRLRDLVPFILGKLASGEHMLLLELLDPFGTPLWVSEQTFTVQPEPLLTPVITSPTLGAFAQLTERQNGVEILLDPCCIPPTGFVQVVLSPIEGEDQIPRSRGTFQVSEDSPRITVDLAYILNHDFYLDVTVTPLSQQQDPLQVSKEELAALSATTVMHLARVTEDRSAPFPELGAPGTLPCQGLECALALPSLALANSENRGSGLEVVDVGVIKDVKVSQRPSGRFVQKLKCKVVQVDGRKVVKTASPGSTLREVLGRFEDDMEMCLAPDIQLEDKDGFAFDLDDLVGDVCDKETIIRML